ncbi:MULTISPECIES: phosphoribosylanthranilate isomerase [unclassified Herbaspirillum]|uniref:phosphoribosylanthranilate isomerase n=1 Tax=unclassified Herbaspirillum TaxID=2624150 RepID=UPI0011504196|nr:MULTISPECIES: phosphoribosylanthranilate isomerase [unclassified Herbaspirillum]MBB5391922.1 phosphoribosylanthranilate isomerase [Herbaspirillum sp. SJZ102]TQK13382.1 phosphoribosylanthranilate isomerase [Herbaspirillum sp. SJZ130]TQK15386.1 phosphoribosylanthranilate isomerase [Herbaspirillum sp. SJZ106]TWC71281.1 phosphoribosylanthranilate isomerase [Herbaspirillum sp. SJZ099]
MTHRTRIKICGLTRKEDVAAAVASGADAVGFVFYPKSPRYVTAQQAAELAAGVPPFVSTVGLFVNPSVEEVRAVLAQVPLTLLQFHGDETPQQCAAIAAAVVRPFMRAARIGSATQPADLLEYELQYRSASPFFNGLLLDTLVEQYGGSGKVFDWSVIPKELAPRAVLSGGLSVHNATEAVAGVRPYAVDISSGVEAAKGIKDAARIAAFIQAVRLADATQA